MSFFDLFRRKKRVVPVAWMRGMPTQTDLVGLRLGSQKTVVLRFCCGHCQKEWDDAVAPNVDERLTCPSCRAVNETRYNLTIVTV